MSVRAELIDVTRRRFNRIYNQILKAMTSYADASTIMQQSVEPRDEFTEALFYFLNAWMGYPYNPTGSFTQTAAASVLETEAQPWWGELDFGFDVVGRFERLEEGDVDFTWIWKTAIADYVQEEWFKNKWQPIIGYNRLMTLRKGPPQTTAKRPYVGRVMEINAPLHAEAVDRAIQKGLKASGFKFEVSKTK